MKKISMMVLALAMFASSGYAATLTNSGFESAWTAAGLSGGGYAYSPTGPGMGWDFLNGAGVSRNFTAWNGVTPDGNQFAFLQAGNRNNLFNGSVISQSFTLATASDVKLSFDMALRPGYLAGQEVVVGIDGISQATYAAASTSWSNQVLDLGVLSAGTYLLGFAGTGGNGGDTSAFLDDVQLSATAAAAPVPEPGTMMLLGGGLLGLAVYSKRRKNV